MKKVIKAIIYFLLIFILLFVTNHYMLIGSSLYAQSVISGVIVFIFSFVYNRVCRTLTLE